jgi:hypothetical protein
LISSIDRALPAGCATTQVSSHGRAPRPDAQFRGGCGARAAGRLRRKHGEQVAKILFWLAAILAAAEQGMKYHDRGLLALASREGRLKGRRGTSHLPRALDVAMAKPIVTAELLAQELKVSARAGQNLIADLGLRELTGRRRYRAWGIL